MQTTELRIKQLEREADSLKQMRGKPWNVKLKNKGSKKYIE
jgi:hypothetical protein